MSTYTPDCWKILKVIPHNTEYPPYFRVLSSWGGSYVYGASWKLSSGIETFEENGDYFFSLQSSGSTYKLHKEAERLSSIMQQMYVTLQAQAEASAKLEIYTLDMFLKEFNAKS